MNRNIRRFLQTLFLAVPAIWFLCQFQNVFYVSHDGYHIEAEDDFPESRQMMKARKLLEDGIAMTVDAMVANSTNHSQKLARHLPQCIIIGARKCGTHALLAFLSLHSKVVTPGDEIHFFSNDTNYRMGIQWYRRRMPLSRADQITIEKTPKYFISSAAAARVHRMNSSIKLIVILRHPTTRLISDFTQIYANRHYRNLSLLHFEAIAINSQKNRVNLDYKALQVGIYHRHISRWLELFPRSQLLVLDGEALIRDPISQISKAETFLGLNHEVNREELYFNKSRGFFCMRRKRKKPGKCMGANKGRKHVNISDQVMQKLNRFYRPHNEALFKIIDQRFSWR